MEKRISFRDFQSAKNVAKTINPYIIQKNKLQAQIDSLEETFNAKFKEKAEQLYKKVQEAQASEKTRLEGLIQGIDNTIALYEAGLLNEIGFHATDLVKKVVETDAKGNKITKYLPTDIVSYDESAKQYVITVADEAVEGTEEAVVPPTTEGEPGLDFDKDLDELPFGAPSENENEF